MYCIISCDILSFPLSPCSYCFLSWACWLCPGNSRETSGAELPDVRRPLTGPDPDPHPHAGWCPNLALAHPRPHGGVWWLGLPKRQKRTEQGFGTDFLVMRIWLLMTLLAGVARCWHQSDWFGMLTSRQRNAACTTRCDYCIQRASSRGIASVDISITSLLQYSQQLPLDVHLWGI